MATNQVNIININNLPEAQDIVNGNKLIVQNDLGTQLIDWANVYILKLDVDGNGSMGGTLVADGARVENCTVDSLSAEYIFSNGREGLSYAEQYLNNFTFTHGIVTSATYIFGSPEYNDIITNRIPAATAYATSVGQAVYEIYAQPTIGISRGGDSAPVVFTSLPSQLSNTNLFKSVDFSISYTGTTILSTIPYIDPDSIVLDNNNNMTANIVLRQAAPDPLSAEDIWIKVSKHYIV